MTNGVPGVKGIKIKNIHDNESSKKLFFKKFALKNLFLKCSLSHQHYIFLIYIHLTTGVPTAFPATDVAKRCE